GRSVVVPGWNAVGRRVGDVVVGAGFGGVQEARVAAVFVGSSKAVKRPSEPARPAGVAAKPLLGRLPQKFSGFEVENSFMRRGSVATHQIATRGDAVADGHIAQPLVIGLAGGVENDADETNDKRLRDVA